MKRTIKSVVSLILICCMLSAFLFSCGTSNNMKFESEEAMREYLCGTFEGETAEIIIDNDTLYYVDKEKLFDGSDSQIDLIVLNHLVDSGMDISTLGFEDFYECCKSSLISSVIKAEPEYEPKKGRVKYNGTVLNVTSDGNLADKDGNIFVWQSAEASFPSTKMNEEYEEYRKLLVARYKEFRQALIPQDLLLDALSSYYYTLSGAGLGDELGKLINRACASYEVEFDNYSEKSKEYLTEKQRTGIESDNSEADIENSYFATVTGTVRVYDKYYKDDPLAVSDEIIVLRMLICVDPDTDKIKGYIMLHESTEFRTYMSGYLVDNYLNSYGW